MRSNEYLTASAVTGEPSSNTARGSSLKTYSFPSGDTVQDAASWGTILGGSPSAATNVS